MSHSKLSFRKVHDAVLAEVLDLEQVYEDRDSDSNQEMVKRGIARRFVRDVEARAN
jgi:hypothetical protein